MSDNYSRVRNLILAPWGLSQNDKAALRHVLGLVNLLAENIAEHTGLPVGEVIDKYSANVGADEATESKGDK